MNMAFDCMDWVINCTRFEYNVKDSHFLTGNDIQFLPVAKSTVKVAA